MMSNKEKIAEYMKKNEGIYFQASEIASVLNIKRNAASALLNEMEREHFLVKRKTRPVLFCYKDVTLGQESHLRSLDQKIHHPMS